MNNKFDPEKPLTSIIGNMLASAQKEPGRLQTKTLHKGLRITMVVNQQPAPKTLTLTLGRNMVFPSAIEWYTVLDAFPWPTGHRNAQRGPNYTLTSTFTIHPKLL